MEVSKDNNLYSYVDIILEYLGQFKLDFVSEIKNHRSIDKYIQSIEEKV